MRVEKPSQFSTGMHFRSHDLMVTLNVAVVKCEAHNTTGRSENQKTLTRKVSSDIRGSKYTRRREKEALMFSAVDSMTPRGCRENIR